MNDTQSETALRPKKFNYYFSKNCALLSNQG
nr:MAG TPA_asm: hypothetical protein [Caudoviricetes sp.]